MKMNGTLHSFEKYCAIIIYMQNLFKFGFTLGYHKIHPWLLFILY